MPKRKRLDSTRMVISSRRRKKFLEILANTGSVPEAARAVGYTNSSPMNRYRKQNKDFAEEWMEALDSFCDVMEAEADRRAKEGVLEPVFYKGDIVGHRINYSDTLMLARLRALKPEKYNPQGSGANVNVKFGVAVLPMQAKNEEAWEQRAIDMHGDQSLIVLEDKPVENTLEKRSGVVRGD
jgi:hypothetical protein